MKRKTYHNLVGQYIKDPNFLYFVSFPRTGSHWFRILMELYTGYPSLVQSWTIDNPNKFWSYHRHDYNLNEIKNKKNVLYLYRNPVNTIYSQLKYEKEAISLENVDFYINKYANHLLRWLFDNEDIENLLVITYESLKGDGVLEMSKVLEFLYGIYGDPVFKVVESKVESCFKNYG
jgi:hypothetical protein